MEETTCREHGLVLSARSRGCLTGVLDVISFDTQTVLLETAQGMLTIRGEELHVSRMYLEKGEVDLEGRVVSLVYSDGGSREKRKRGSLVKRLFQ